MEKRFIFARVSSKMGIRQSAIGPQSEFCPIVATATSSLKPLVLGQKFAMTLGGIIIILLLVVSVITFIYLIVVTARSWGVLHTLMLFCLFVECWVFMIFSAGVLYRRGGWLKQAQTLEARAIKAEAETVRLTWGNYEGNPDAQDAVVPVQGELRRLTADRGRVWRNLDLVSQENGLYKLELSTAAASVADDLAAPEPVAAPAAAPVDVGSSLPTNLVVYGFAEEADEENRPLPDFYLGEFTVTQSQGGEVALTPTLPLEPNQLDRIKTGAAQTWTLYELLPLDSHTAFAAQGSQPADDAIFGRMDEETLTGLLANIPDERRDQILQSYLRDGQRAEDSDPPRSRWVRVKLLKEWTVDVDSQEDAIATERGFFDTSGRSIDVRLKRGEEGSVKLSPDETDRIVLKSEVADDLISKGIAELIEPVYVRPLNDYQEAFNQLFVRIHEIQERITLYQRESAEMAKANQAGQEMISFRQIENQQLASDLGHYRTEIDVLNDEIVEATDKLNNTKSALTEMYRFIQSRAR
jgi:hypothetical protein